MLSKSIFLDLHKQWGPFSCDRFASYKSNQLNCFFSRWWNPLSSGINCFTVSWNLDLNWCFPPPRLISRTIDHMKSQSACGCIILPFWPSSWWWPMLCATPFTFHDFIINWTDLPNIKDLFIPASSKHNTVFTGATPKFRVLAIRICFCHKCTKFPPIQNNNMSNVCNLPFFNN